MFRRKSNAVVGVAAATAIALSGCTSTTSSGQSGGGAIDPSNLVLVASVINTTNPYMASMIEGAQALGKKLGVEVQIVDSAEKLRLSSNAVRPRRQSCKARNL